MPETNAAEPTNTGEAESLPPLAERYIEVTLDHIPVAERGAVDTALRGAISGEIEDRYNQLLGDENVTREDIEVDVLGDMGDPERVAATMVDRPLFLIGPRFFLDYKRLLSWLLTIVVPVAAALAMVSAAHHGAELGTMLFAGLGAAVTAALYTAAWTTLGFAGAERVARPGSQVASAHWDIDSLPQPVRRKISVPETTIVVVTALVTAVVIVWQHLRPSIFTGQGDPVPFLNPDHWPWLWSGIVALLAIVALAGISRHVHGHWTYMQAWVNLAISTLTFGLVVWIMLDHSFLNIAFFAEVGWPIKELPTVTLENWAAAVIAVIWLIDVALGFVKARRAT